MVTMATLILTTYLIALLGVVYAIYSLKGSCFSSNVKLGIKLASFISLIPVLILTNNYFVATNMGLKWADCVTTPLNLYFHVDMYASIFIPIALFVSWSIVQYSIWYMSDDLQIRLFFKYLLMFLLTMILLVSSGNFLLLFFAWEGVGMMSYLLIGWYFTRSNAGMAALQAVIYNRIGDIGFMFMIFIMLTTYNSMEFSHVYSEKPSTTLLLGLIIAAASKSAQFGMHPWLASAMEGPTPVSALLHSSTMVVAGVFLLIRIYPMLKGDNFALMVCLCLGALTSVYGAACAVAQNDLKKIIAYSTSSQLGLMMVAIGLNMPYLAFFHICTHAFFKAMLFLCAGSIIHNLEGEQDIRKMGGLQKALPVTTTCITIGSLALMGIPYLAGFYSKDAIIEAINIANINAAALALTLIATSLTAVYSLRMIFFASMQTPRFMPNSNIHEDQNLVAQPIKRLAYGAILTGLFLGAVLASSYSSTMTMPTSMKVAAIVITLIGFIIAWALAALNWTSLPEDNTLKSVDTSFTSTTTHRSFSSTVLGAALVVAAQFIDAMLLKKLFPKNLSDTQLPPMKKIQEMERGLMKIYLAFFAFTALICVIASIFF